MSPPKALIIDLDGTILNTSPDFHAAINAMRRDLGFPGELSLTEVTNLVGKGSENLVRGILTAELPPSEAESLFSTALSSYQNHYQAINGKFSSLYPGAREGLAAFAEMGLAMACVTNKPYAFAKDLLQQFALDHYFSLLYGGDSFARKKPDPEPILAACQHFSLAPQQVLVLGDSSNDAQAARAAGCPVWILPYGFNHGESVHKINSDGIVSTLFVAAQQIAAQP